MKLIGSRGEQLGETLGAGGQAQVGVVIDRSKVLPGNWAAKVFHNSNRAARIEHWIRTARQGGRGIIEIVDAYLRKTEPSASNPWFVMRLAPGGSLGKQFQGTTSPYNGSVPAALKFFRTSYKRSCSSTRNASHTSDLKPDNIILIDQQPFLADLGLCLPLEDPRGQSAFFRRTRAHWLHSLRPKEAFGRRPLDEDQFAFNTYALGGTLYQLVSGRLLPGFTSPNEPEFSLLKIPKFSSNERNKSISERILFDDSPAVRKLPESTV